MAEELVSRLRKLEPPKGGAPGSAVLPGSSAPVEVVSSTVSGGRVVIDVDTLRALSEAVFRVTGKDYTDYVYNICTSSPSFLSTCRELADVVRRCRKELVPKLVPTQLDTLARYVLAYVDSYCKN